MTSTFAASAEAASIEQLSAMFLSQTSSISTTISGPATEPRRSPSGSRNPTQSESSAHIYGYHQAFHTHAAVQLDSPPSYEAAQRAKPRLPTEPAAPEALPAYSCTVFRQDVMSFKKEFTTPFTLAQEGRWHDVYVLLQGTQLTFHRVKNPSMFSKRKAQEPGKLLRAYTLQHAEVGIATDFKKTDLIPRHPLAHLVPPGSRAKVYETDPHLFEPVREHVIRLRLESEQLLLCAASQEQLLDWVELISAAIDIAQPLEDRSEPRYRSLPRRSRRQRQLDSRLMAELDNLDAVAEGRRLIAEQERILQQLYPNLANPSAAAARRQSVAATSAPAQNEVDPEEADLDRADVTFPGQRPLSTALSVTSQQASSPEDAEQPIQPPSTTASSRVSGDPKTASHHAPTYSQRLRYRRRCAPILLFQSPRASEIVMHKGKRMRIDGFEMTLKPWSLLPPRYESHGYPKPAPSRPVSSILSVPVIPQIAPALARPALPARAATEDSIAWTLSSDNEITPVTTRSVDTSAASSDLPDSRSMESQDDPVPMSRSKSNEAGNKANRSGPASAAAGMASMLASKLRRSSLDQAVEDLRLVN